MAWIVNNVGDLNVYTPIVYAGDLNLVGYAQQLETLLTGDINKRKPSAKEGCQIGMRLLGQMPCPVRLINLSRTLGETMATAISPQDAWTLSYTATP